jgi:polysaccharide biosynthesis transport protein
MAGASNFVSVSRRPPDVEDYIDMMRRYRSWIIGPTFAGLVISVVVAFLWQDTYRSVAVMRIAPQKVSERLVPSEVTQRMTERLNQMEQEILSRSQLIALITQPAMDLYKKERQQRPTEDIVQDMRNKYIQIRMLGLPGADSGGRVASAFSISFDYPDKYRAKQVVDQLVGRFMEQNISQLKANNRITTQFLDDQVKTASDRLNDLSQKITKFKMENQGKLPEQAAANVAMVNSLQQNLATESEALSRAKPEDDAGEPVERPAGQHGVLLAAQRRHRVHGRKRGQHGVHVGEEPAAGGFGRAVVRPADPARRSAQAV